VSLLRLRPFSGLRNISPRPRGRLESHTAGRHLASAGPWGFFMATRRQPQCPLQLRSARTLLASKKAPEIHVPSVNKRAFWEYLALKNSIGIAEREILAFVMYVRYVQTLPYKAFPTTIGPADHSCWLTPPSPLPCHTGHGHGVTSSHHEEVGVSADGNASASLSGVAAVSPPADAHSHYSLRGGVGDCRKL
jgi:hypothetical protein